MDLIKKLFGTVPSAPPLESPSRRPPEGIDTRMMELDAATATRREMLRVVTRNTQRYAGIPESWIESQVLLELRRGETFMHLRLLVKHWDERLLRYSVAFQRQLLGEIEQLEPDARQWLLSIAWQFPHDLDCPHPELPAPSFWSTDPITGKTVHVDLELDAEPDAAPEPEPDDLQADLARLIAVRDAELGQAGGKRGENEPR